MWSAIVAVVLGSVATAVVGRLGAEGNLPRNLLAGVRTPGTLADDTAWDAAHRAAGSWLVGGGVGGAVLGASAAAAVVAGRREDEVAALVSGATGALLLGAVVGGVRGDHAARAVAAARGSGGE